MSYSEDGFVLWCFLTDEYWTGDRWVFDKDRAKIFNSEKEASEYEVDTPGVHNRFGVRNKSTKYGYRRKHYDI